MKKYTVFLFAFFSFAFIFNVFTANLASAVSSECDSATSISAVTGKTCTSSTLPAGCFSGANFSTTTGKPCSDKINTVVGCQTGFLFSPVTGQPCGNTNNSNNDNPKPCSVSMNREFTIGSKGDDVRSFQQTLKDEGYLSGKVDGVYGPVTNGAKLNYYKKCPPPTSNNSVVISGVSGPQSLDVNEQGTWTVKAYDKNGGTLSYSVVWQDESGDLSPDHLNSNANLPSQQSATFTHSYYMAGKYTPRFYVTSENTIRCIKAPCPTNGGSAHTTLTVNVGGVSTHPSSLTVLSPNGGDVWVRGATQKIKWKNNGGVTCPTGSYCAPQAPNFYDIKLASTYPACTTDICPAIGYMLPAPRVIATSVSGYSYDWKIGQVVAGVASLGSNRASAIYDTVVDGSYIIEVCQTGTDICDSSDSSFKIISYDKFASCLQDKKAVLYGAFWCPHCQTQKKLFGASEKLVPYVECSTTDGTAQTQACIDKKITTYPTWEFADGSRLLGEIPLQTLSEKTSCDLPK